MPLVHLMKRNAYLLNVCNLLSLVLAPMLSSYCFLFRKQGFDHRPKKLKCLTLKWSFAKVFIMNFIPTVLLVCAVCRQAPGPISPTFQDLKNTNSNWTNWWPMSLRNCSPSVTYICQLQSLCYFDFDQFGYGFSPKHASRSLLYHRSKLLLQKRGASGLPFILLLLFVHFVNI